VKPRRRRDDRGSAAIELPLSVGLLLIPVVILVLALPQWPERQSIATGAARQAASLYATGASPETGADVAQASVAQTAANAGLDGLQLELSGEWCRGCEVTARVTVTIPAIIIPFAGDTGTFQWTATSTARVDDYRSISPGGTP
jgi:Flp pilus assembly protein TadG